MFAIMLPLFIGAAAIVVDVGYWWVNGRKAQIAADACALAAARDLPQTPPSPTGGDAWNIPHCRFGTPERDYVLTNLPAQGPGSEPVHDPADGTRVVWPYNGDRTLVEATVKLKVTTFFGRYVGLSEVDLTRRAVAEQSVGQGEWAIYAHDETGCSDGNGLEIVHGGIRVDGRAHSNSYFHVNSGNPPNDSFWADVGTIATNPCNPTLNPSPGGAAYGTGAEPRPHLPTDSNFEEWPTWYTPAMFNWPTCTGAAFSARNINIKGDKVELKGKLIGGGDQDIPHSGTVPTGTYCATEKLTTSDTVRGRVTLLSPQLDIGGSTDFDANERNVLFFSVPNWTPSWNADPSTSNDGGLPSGDPTCTDPAKSEMKLNGKDVSWTGTIFNPCGRVNLNNSPTGSGPEPEMVGAIIAEMVRVNQPAFNLTGQSDFGGTVTLALDQ
jgi:Putative Flp pilus-assembly TadE/G-like